MQEQATPALEPETVVGAEKEESSMERVAIVARLKEGSGPRAAELIARGPSFDLAELGLVPHSIYLSADEVVFRLRGSRGRVARGGADR